MSDKHSNYPTPLRGLSAILRDKPITVDRALQTIAGLLLTIVSFISWQMYTQIQNHEGRLIRFETRQDAIISTLNEIRNDIKEIKRGIDHERYRAASSSPITGP